MKQSKLRIILAGVTAVIVLAVSCSKSFLDKNPIGSLDQNTLANKAGVEGLLIGAYSLLDGFGGAGGGWQSAGSNWVYGGVASDDAYKGSDPGDQADIVPIETYAPTASNGILTKNGKPYMMVSSVAMMYCASWRQLPTLLQLIN